MVEGLQRPGECLAPEDKSSRKVTAKLQEGFRHGPL